MSEGRLQARIQSLGDGFTPQFGQVSLWVVLAVGAWLLNEVHLDLSDVGTKGNAVSVLGLVLPESVLTSKYTLLICRWTFWGAALCWGLRKFAPWSCWIAVLAYTATVSLYWENLTYFLHKFICCNWVLVAYALWYTLYRREIRAADEAGSFWETALYPRWVAFSSVVAISLFYTYSGLIKIVRSGFAWADGLSLQIWMSEMGDSQFFLTNWVVEDRRVAMALAVGTLLFECLAFVAIFNRHFRWGIGLCLIAMHLSIEMTMHIDFASNMFLLLVFFLPWLRWSPRLTVRWEEFWADPPEEEKPARA